MFMLPFPARDGNTTSGTESLGALPEWDLSDLYASPDAPELLEDMSWLERECSSFAKDYEGQLADLSSDSMLTCVQRNEKISNVAGRVMSFASLRYYQMTTDEDRTKFLSDAQEKITNFTTPLVFFSLEMNRLEDSHLENLMAQNENLARYKRAFERMRAMKPHQLSDEMEKFIHDLGAVGDAWEKLFDETIAGLSFDANGETRNIEGTLDFLMDHDRSKREAAARELANVFSKNIKVILIIIFIVHNKI